MKKYIANVITGSRILFSVPLLFIHPSSAWFYALYLFCGFTDMIDGAIARKTESVSKFGARLDTAADFIFMLVCCVRILPQINIHSCLWAWTILIALTKIFNIVLVLIRNKKLISMHTVLNKMTGAALFLLPLTLTFLESTYSVAAICVLATVASVQEAYFVARGQDEKY